MRIPDSGNSLKNDYEDALISDINNAYKSNVYQGLDKEVSYKNSVHSFFFFVQLTENGC